MKTLATLLAITLAPLSATARQAARPAYPESFTRALVGKVGERDVHMLLSYFRGKLEGRYSFAPASPAARSWVTELQLTGTLADDGTLEMQTETDQPRWYYPAGRPDDGCLGPVGTFSGTLTGSPWSRDEPIRIEGTWSDDDNEYPFALAERRMPAGSRFRIRSKSFGVSGDAPVTSPGIIYPELVGPGGRRVEAFSRAIRRRLDSAMATFESNASQGDGDAEREGSSMDVDYELVYASPELVSVLFREHAWYEGLLPHDSYSEYCVAFDLRRNAELDLVGQFQPAADARRALWDAAAALFAASQWSEDSHLEQQVREFDDWAFDEHGVLVCYSVENSSGSAVQVLLPWAYFRRGLKPSSSLRRLAFPAAPRRRATAPSA